MDLSGLKLERADLHGADLTGAKLVGTDLQAAILSDALMDGTDLTERHPDGRDRQERRRFATPNLMA